MSLEGRVAIVSGGSRGIGKGISLALARAGADIALNYLRKERPAQETTEAIRALGRRVVAIKADITNFADTAAYVDRVTQEFGKVDLLVNCAAIASRGHLLADTDVEEFRRVIETDVVGPFHLTKAALPILRLQKRADIIFISSDAVRSYTPGTAPYAAAKAAVQVMARCLAREEWRHGIRVNTIEPALCDTDMGRKLLQAATGYESIAEVDSLAPFGRILRPEDVGSLCVFLASAAGGHISGETIGVGGPELSWDLLPAIAANRRSK